MNPVFSLCHPTARPLMWEKTCHTWLANCVDPSQCEYILGIHKRQAELPELVPPFKVMYGKILESLYFSGWPFRRAVINEGDPTMVNNANGVALASVGYVLVDVNDDLFPCARWDEALLAAIGDRGLDSEFVIKVSINAPDGTSYHPGIITHPIVSSRYFERVGPTDPRYLGYGCDDDFTAHAYRDGVVIEAPQIVFEHRHWTNGGRPKDAIDEHNGRPEVWERKAELNRERRAAGFPKVTL